MAKGLKQAAFRFSAFSRKQTQILTWWLPESGVSDYDGIIADGAIRSGKTVSMALSFVMWAMHDYNGLNFAMCGKTIGSFRRNVIAVLKPMLRSRGYRYADHRSDNLLEVRRDGKTNYFYIFGGKDERSQDLIQGITLAGLLCDEVALMPESFVNQATARCSVDGAKLWFNCNPGSPSHWFKTKFVDKLTAKRLLYLHFTMDDNLSLSERVKARYRSMYVGVFYRRYILGEWCLADGLVYPMFDPEKHVIHDCNRIDGLYYISIDYGTLNPFSAGLWCWDGSTATRLKEYYYSGRDTSALLTDEEYYTQLEKLAGDLPIIYVVVDPSAASFIECVRRHGRFTVIKAVNDVLDGIRYTSTLISTGRIRIADTCTDCIREFTSYVWDTDDTSGTDKVIKENDHAMDETRYFCYTVLRRKIGSVAQ